MSGDTASAERRLLVSLGAGPATAREALVLQAGDAWALPRLDGEARRAADVDDVAPALRARFGLAATVLRCLHDAPAAGGPRRQAFEIEVHAPATSAPPAARWMAAAELRAATFGDPRDRALVDAWLDPAPPGARKVGDWERPGWWARALGWAEGELARRGLGGIAEAVQVRVWEYAHVLRLRAGGGEFYLKARPPGGAGELRLTARLAVSHPATVPAVVALDADRGWLLMRAAPGPALLDVGDLAAWTAAGRALAELQIDWIERTGELAALGCPARPIEALAAEVAPLLADQAALQPDVPEDALTADELVRLRAAAGALRARCEALAALGMPTSLEHGDAWAANVVASPRGPVFLDWEDAAVAHPFLTPYLLTLSVAYAPALADRDGAREAIGAAYRAAWRARGPLAGWSAERIARGFALAQVVAPLHYAVQFRHGLSQIETSWEVRGYCPFFARLALQSL